MSTTELQAATRSSTLEIEVEADLRLMHERRVRPSDLERPLRQVGSLCGMAISNSFNTAEVVPREDRLEAEPQLLRVEFGSPLSILVDIPTTILRDVVAMSLILYGAKRLWGIPLEFRAHHQDLLERLYRAEARASAARQRREEARVREEEALMAQQQRLQGTAGEKKARRAYREAKDRALAAREATFAEIDRENEWVEGSIGKIEELSSTKWKGRSGVWRVEDE
jgi:hypothetical protein